MIPNVENLSLAKASTDPIPNPVLFSGKWFYLRGAGSTNYCDSQGVQYLTYSMIFATCMLNSL